MPIAAKATATMQYHNQPFLRRGIAVVLVPRKGEEFVDTLPERVIEATSLAFLGTPAVYQVA
jgi:hypothetical protein